MASSANQENRKVIGYGASSCTFRPPLECADHNIRLGNNNLRKPVISQITDLASADLKVNMVHKLRLDRLGEEILNQYFILVPLPLESSKTKENSRREKILPLRQCPPRLNNERLTEQCPIYSNFLHQPTSMVYFNNGGNDLTKLTKEEELLFYFNWLVNFLNIFQGVKILIDNNIIHLDIKRANIVYNPRIPEKGFRLIDFDMANKIDQLKESDNFMFFNFLNIDIWKNFNNNHIDLVIPLNCYLIYCFKLIELKKNKINDSQLRKLIENYTYLEYLLKLDDYNFKNQMKLNFIKILQNYHLFLNFEPHTLKNNCLFGFYTEFFGSVDYFKEFKTEQFYTVIDADDSPTELTKIYRHIDLYSLGLCLLEFCFQNDTKYKLRNEGRNEIQDVILQFIFNNKLLHQDLIIDDNFDIDTVIENYHTLLQFLRAALEQSQSAPAAADQPYTMDYRQHAADNPALAASYNPVLSASYNPVLAASYNPVLAASYNPSNTNYGGPMNTSLNDEINLLGGYKKNTKKKSIKKTNKKSNKKTNKKSNKKIIKTFNKSKKHKKNK